MPRLTLHDSWWPQQGRHLHLLVGVMNARTAVDTWLPLHQPTQGDMLYDNALPKYFSLGRD